MVTANDTVTGAEPVAASGEVEKENNAVTGEEPAASKEEGATAGKAVTEGESAAPGKPDAQARIRQLAEEKAYWKGVAEGRVQKPEPSKVVEPVQQTKPTPDKYQSYDDYVEALSDWKASEKVKAEFEIRERTSREATERRFFMDKLAIARQKYQDFEEIVLNPDLKISGAMMEVIKTSDKGSDIAYFLGKNPGEADRIANLSPHLAAMELGVISAKLSSMPEPRRVTQAPSPVSTVGGTAQTSTPPEAMSMDDWMKWRESTLQT